MNGAYTQLCAVVILILHFRFEGEYYDLMIKKSIAQTKHKTQAIRHMLTFTLHACFVDVIVYKCE